MLPVGLVFDGVRASLTDGVRMNPPESVHPLRRRVGVVGVRHPKGEDAADGDGQSQADDDDRHSLVTTAQQRGGGKTQVKKVVICENKQRDSGSSEAGNRSTRHEPQEKYVEAGGRELRRRADGRQTAKRRGRHRGDPVKTLLTR